MPARLLFVAATTRMSTRWEPVAPTRSTLRSWRALSSLACADGDRSETSSRNKVPPSACSNLPRRPRTPVAIRSSMPKSSASRSVSTSAAQLTATNGPWRRRLDSWICRATSSLPTPLSPSRSTVKSVAAIRSMLARRACMGGVEPTSGATLEDMSRLDRFPSSNPARVNWSRLRSISSTNAATCAASPSI